MTAVTGGASAARVPVTQIPSRRAPLKRQRKAGWGCLAMQHQLELSLAVILFILAANALSTPLAHLSTQYTPDPSYHYSYRFARFLFISFRQPGTSLYFKGRDDAYVITWWVVCFWFIRESLMRFVLEPIARRAGIKERRAIVRFTEQGYSLCYYTVFWLLGLYIMQISDYKNLNTAQYYIGYPHDALPALTKWYYLVQTAFYIQQILVLHIEERRKDYVQMFAHHIITTLLMSFSYVFNYTRVGNAILCTMDLVDIILSLAKLFNYSGMTKVADVTFGVFLVTWIGTRHILYNFLLWSVYFELPTILEYDWRPREGYFNSRTLHYTFCALLTALQLILCLWLGMILKVVYKIIFSGASAEDVRSDDEGDDSEYELDEELEDEERKPIAAVKEILPKMNGLTSGHGNGSARLNGDSRPQLERKKDRSYSNSSDDTRAGAGRQMDDNNASMSGDTSSRSNVNNEGATSESTFSESTGSDPSDKFDSAGASGATSAGQSGAGSIGSSGNYSSATEDSSYNDRSEERRGAQYSSGESRSEGRETGRQMNDDYASKSGDTSSEPNVNNEFSNSSGDGSYDADAQGTSASTFADQSESSSSSSLGGPLSGEEKRRERGDYEDGGTFEEPEGYGRAPVERSEQSGDFQ